jgi:hypothetical protein
MNRFGRNGAAILLSTFSLSLMLFWLISMTAEAARALGPCSRFRNRDMLVPSSLRCIRERRDRSPCTHILYQTYFLTSPAISFIRTLLYHIFRLLPAIGELMEEGRWEMGTENNSRRAQATSRRQWRNDGRREREDNSGIFNLEH